MKLRVQIRNKKIYIELFPVPLSATRRSPKVINILNIHEFYTYFTIVR